MIRCKGDVVSFELVSRDLVELSPWYGMHHDPDGEDWPPCSVMFGPYERTRRRVEPVEIDREYYGDCDLYEMKIDLPPVSLSKWTKVDEVKRIWYWRNGERFPFEYVHKFKRRTFFGRQVPAVLYEHGAFCRLEMPGDCVVSWRGYVSP